MICCLDAAWVIWSLDHLFSSLAAFFFSLISPYRPGRHGCFRVFTVQLQFTSLIVACFVLARRDVALERRGWVWYSVATGLLVAASDVAFALTARLLDGGPPGLIERIGIIGCGIWIALLAICPMRGKVLQVPAVLIGSAT